MRTREQFAAFFESIERAIGRFAGEVEQVCRRVREGVYAEGGTAIVLREPRQEALNFIRSTAQDIQAAVREDREEIEGILATPEPLRTEVEIADRDYRMRLLEREFPPGSDIASLVRRLEAAVADDDGIGAEVLLDLVEAERTRAQHAPGGADRLDLAVSLVHQLEQLRPRVELLRASGERRRALEHLELADEVAVKAHFVAHAADARLGAIVRREGDDPTPGIFALNGLVPPGLTTSSTPLFNEATFDIGVITGQRPRTEAGSR